MTHANNYQIRNAYAKYCRGNLPYSLDECYHNPSNAKHKAYEYCLQLVQKFNGGYSYAILSYNCMAFSFGFVGIHPTNNREIFVYITKDYDRFAYLDELPLY